MHRKDAYFLALISLALLTLLWSFQTWPWCADVTWESTGSVPQGPSPLENIPIVKHTQANRSSHFYSMSRSLGVQHWLVQTEPTMVGKGWVFYLHFRGKDTRPTEVKLSSPCLLALHPGSSWPQCWLTMGYLWRYHPRTHSSLGTNLGCFYAPRSHSFQTSAL